MPAELLFRLGSTLQHRRYDRGLARRHECGAPVISVGNLTVGGTGKTPFVGWLVSQLKADARRPAVLHGGYALDEPELLQAWHDDVPVLARRDRVAAAHAATAAGADVIVLDDGFQHRRLARDLDIVLVAAEQWSASPRLLPRGPWREPPTALRRAGVVVVTRKSAAAARAVEVAAQTDRLSGGAAAMAQLAPAGWRTSGGRHESWPAAMAGEAVLVTAVAEWRPVAEHAEMAGARLGEALIFPDHHAFDAADAERIRRFAGRRAVACTEKDWVKLRRLLPADRLVVLVQRIVFDAGEDRLRAALRNALNR